MDGTATTKKPLLKQFKTVRFLKHSSCLFYTTEINSSNFKSFKLLRDKFSPVIPKIRAGNLSEVSTDRKKGIIEKLVPYMNLNYQKFWNELVVNENIFDLKKQKINVEKKTCLK